MDSRLASSAVGSASTPVGSASPIASVAVGLVGSAALGGCIAAFAPGDHSPDLCGRFPVFLIIVASLTLPALYIALAYLGVAPRAMVMAGAAARAFGTMGVVALGLAPALCFVLATSTVRGAALVGAALTLLLAAVLGLRRLFEHTRVGVLAAPSGQVISSSTGRRVFIFAVWTLVCGELSVLLFTSIVLPEVY